MKFKRFIKIFSAACIIGLLGAMLPVTGVFAAPTLTVNPTTGPAGTQIYVNGTSTVSGGAITINCPTLGLSATVNAASTGGPNFAWGPTLLGTVPPASRGNYPITATDTSGTSTPTNFTVTPQLLMTVTTGQVGDTVVVTGNGFSSASTVSIYWDTLTTPIATATSALGTGTLPATNIVIPQSVRGFHYLYASDLSGSTPQLIFTVNSKLTLTPATGASGDSVTVTGDGFSGSTQVNLQVDGNPLITSPSTVNSNAAGHFSATFVVPSLSRGNHTVVALDGSGSANANFAIGQKITITPASGIAGDTITIAGSGFSPNQNITVKVDGTVVATTPSSLASNSAGAFSATIAIPALSGGTHVVSATDTDLNVASANLTVNAKITIATSPATTPASGPTGTPITVSGSGFVANATINIYWDAVALPVATTTANSTGALNPVTFNAPVSVKGNHTVKATDNTNQASATFAITPKIVLNPVTGAYQDSITATGTGFAAGSTVTLSINSGSTSYSVTTTPATVTSDASGSFSASFAVAPVFSGNWTIRATDSSANTAEATLAVTAKLLASGTTGGAGDPIAVTGTGFGPNKSITLKFNGVTLVTTPASITSDANGQFSAQFAVPPSVAGTIPLTATDGTSTASLNFTATPKATISKATSQADPGYVGLAITVSGTGFKANSAVTVTFEGVAAPVASVTSDANGSFSAPFTVPPAAAGSHKVTATDGTTSKEFVFFMDSTAPPAVTLIQPTDKFKPKQPIPFSWNSVDDPSGVTYTLQISQDAAFGTLVLEKTGLTETGYAMTAAEKLKNAGSGSPYYWRVRATDKAGNVGAWSTANTFTLGFIWPSWMIHVWYGLGIVVALILGLWLGRRMAYQSY